MTFTKKITRRQAVLKDSVIRDFGGGLNVIDSDLNLSTKFSKVLTNFMRDADGSLGLRFGTKKFSSFSNVITGTYIVESFYWNKGIIGVSNTGQIGVIDGTGFARVIWNDEIAMTLPDSPSGWGDTTFVTMDTFNGALLITNGIDKPLIVTGDFIVDYLGDPATGANGNTPIAPIVVRHLNYTVFIEGTTIHVSAERTSGVFVGDAAPNDAVDFDLGSYIPSSDTNATGAVSYRDQLIVTFYDCAVIIELGTYDTDGNHIPAVKDVIIEHGSISHRTMKVLGSDVLYADNVGVPSIQRALFTGTLQPNRESQLIDPKIQEFLVGLSQLSLLERVFSIYHRLEGQYMLFVPDDEYANGTINTKGFVYTSIPKLKIDAWSMIDGWKWESGCRTVEGRIFFTKGMDVFIYGSNEEPLYADFIGDQETFSDDTVFTDNTGFTPISDDNDSGIPINFVWELPWVDFDARMRVKKSRYLLLDTEGTANFTVDMFVDRIYLDRTDLGEEFSDDTDFTDGYGFESDDIGLLPALSMDFIAGDADGFGLDGFGEQFGGGRITGTEKLYAWPALYKLAKFRIHGSTRRKLKFIALGLAYQDGSIRR